MGWFQRGKRKLRYTGENPPLDVLVEHPNWVYALGEEDVDGQDETTLKPEDLQTQVTDETAFTAGDLVFADGERLTVLIYFVDGEALGVAIYRDSECPYLTYDERLRTWKVLPDHGSADPNRAERWWDERAFPVRITSRLPLASTGAPWETTIGPVES